MKRRVPDSYRIKPMECLCVLFNRELSGNAFADYRKTFCLLSQLNNLNYFNNICHVSVRQVGPGDPPVPADAVRAAHQRARPLPLLRRAAARARVRRRRVLGGIRSAGL